MYVLTAVPAGALLILLAAPAALELSAAVHAGTLSWRVRLELLNGVIGWQVLPRAGTGRKTGAPVSPRQKNRNGRSKAVRRSRLFREVFPLVPRAVKMAARHLRIRRVFLRGRFGFADPAWTGIVYGGLQLLKCLPADTGRLDIRPDFEKRAADLQGGMRICFVPGIIIALCAAMLIEIGLQRVRRSLN